MVRNAPENATTSPAANCNLMPAIYGGSLTSNTDVAVAPAPQISAALEPQGILV